ncbi:MAG: hypothetical protein CL524_01130 [Aequorivita sp.]|nr:hypothetical protein [Aequorivita sp.]
MNYLVNRATPDGTGYTGFTAELLSGSAVVNDTLSRELLDQGWLLCETYNTGCRYFVKPRRNSRFLAAWGARVTDFDVRRVDTIANSDGVILAALGEKIKGMPKLFARVEILKEYDRLIAL